MRSDDFNLKHSSATVGRLYPVLYDKHGNVIDGLHRLAFDPTWPKLKLCHIKSEKDRLLVRLISNVCRRTVPPREKRELIKGLAEIYVKEGEEKKNLAVRISKETGMTYRWVMKYLPQHLKIRPGLGGPLKTSSFAECKEALDSNTARLFSTSSLANLQLRNNQKPVILKTYVNADFVNLTIERKFFERFEKLANQFGIETDVLINNAIIVLLKEIEHIVDQRIVTQEERMIPSDRSS